MHPKCIIVWKCLRIEKIAWVLKRNFKSKDITNLPEMPLQKLESLKCAPIIDAANAKCQDNSM